MEASGVPVKFSVPFASSATAGTIRAIPTASQIGIQNGAASLTTGFPPNTLIAKAAGGAPPFAQDFNGILNQITSWDQWVQAGAPIAYDSEFQSSIGGYPAGAVIQSAAYPGTYWLSSVDANSTNPDAAGAGWVRYLGAGIQAFSASGTLTVPSWITAIKFRMWGGGGAGGGSSGSGSAGAGGGGGAYSEGVAQVIPGGTYSVTVAAATAGGSGAGATAGATTFAAFASCGGGVGGAGGGGGIVSNNFAAGGAATGGAVSLNGGFGRCGYAISAGIVMATGGYSFGFPGGAQSYSNTSVQGDTGPGFGCGGSGGLNGGMGGNGAPGFAIFEW